MTTQYWLQGSVGFDLTDFNIQSIFIKRDVEYGGLATDMTEKQQDLSIADACVIYLLSSNKGTNKKQDGNSSKSDGGESFTYRDEVAKIAIALYEKWEVVPPSILGNVITNATNLW